MHMHEIFSFLIMVASSSTNNLLLMVEVALLHKQNSELQQKPLQRLKMMFSSKQPS